MNEVVSDESARVVARHDAPAQGAGARVPAICVSIAMLFAAVPLFWPAFVELAARWDEPAGGNSHGYVVVALVPWLAWLRRDRVAFRDGGRGIAIGAMFCCGIAYAMARSAHVELAAWVVLPVLLFATAIACHGWRGGRSLAFPIAYLYFALPVWALLTPALQAATVAASSAMLRALGLRVYIDGDFVTVPAGTFEIAGGCAGTSFFVVALATATTFAFVEGMRMREALRLCAVAAGMAIVLNWLRVATIIVVGNATAMRTSLVADHFALGWWMFAAGLVPLFVYARRLAARSGPPPRIGAAPRVDASRAAAVSAAALAVLALGPVLATFVADRVGAVPVLHAPDVSGWRKDPSTGRWRPEFPGAAATVEAAYRRGDANVDAFAAFYGHQGPLRKLIGYPSDVAGGSWSMQASRDVDDRLRPFVRRGELSGPGGRRRAVWSWYEVRGERFRSAWQVKLHEALGAFGLPARSGVVALSAECRPDCELAHETIAAAYDAGLARISAGTASR